jgi:hypothetical protein
MKTKLILIAMVGLLYTSEIRAQVVQGGLLIGVSTAQVNIKDLNTSLRKDANGKSIWGMEGGVYAKLNFSPFYLKPMALASYQSGEMTLNNKDGSILTSNFNAGRFEVPVLLGLHIIGPFLSVEAGPAYNWIFYANTQADGNISVTSSSIGYRLGATSELGRLVLGLAYEGIVSNSSSSTTKFEMPMELAFNIGVLLGRIKE